MLIIKKFAVDYRTLSSSEKWTLPYIRIGGTGCDSAINIGTTIENDKYCPAMSELDKVWWVWKNIKEFGDPDFIGFCHYRRFFTLSSQLQICNISASQFNSKMCLSPEEELVLISKNNAVGASMFPIKCSNSKMIWDQMHDLEAELLPDINKRMFDMLLEASPLHLKDSIAKSFEQEKQYVCNIFTLRREYFDELCKMMFKVLPEFNDFIPLDIKKTLHPRYLGYYGERIVSCYLHAIQLNGAKILHLPLLTIDANKHNEVKVDPVSGMKYEVK